MRDRCLYRSKAADLGYVSYVGLSSYCGSVVSLDFHFVDVLEASCFKIADRQR